MEALFGMIAIGLVIWALSKRNKPLPPSHTKRTVELTGNGKYDYEIVGESHYQRNIMKALNLSGGQSSKSFQVTLIHDDYNKYDNQAIAVYIGEYKVGHLSKGKARGYRKLMKDLGFEGLYGKCNGTVWGGGSKKNYGIWLDYKPRLMRKKYS
ncbi:MAG: hypothetical protein CL666_04615 [Balneola sp.]|nr:hypothetical protein [Balneola sp.]